jgi:hypothetical protein
MYPGTSYMENSVPRKSIYGKLWTQELHIRKTLYPGTLYPENSVPMNFISGKTLYPGTSYLENSVPRNFISGKLCACIDSFG